MSALGTVDQYSLRYATSRVRVVPLHALYTATADQGGHSTYFFSSPGAWNYARGTMKAAFGLFENGSTFTGGVL